MDHRLLDYEQEFLNGYALFKATLSSLKEEDQQPAMRRKDINKCTRLLSSADTALRQLELEARMRGGGEDRFNIEEDYKSLQSRTESYRRELQQAFRELREARSAVERLLLINSTTDELSSKNHPSALQRQRLLCTAETAHKGLQTLQSSRVLALETEVLGSTVITELQSQRQTIQQTISRVTTVREGLHEASATLQRIVRAAFRTKMVTYAVVMVVILALAYITLRKFVPLTSLRPAPATGGASAPQKATPRDEANTNPTPVSVSSKQNVRRSVTPGSEKIDTKTEKARVASPKNVLKAEQSTGEKRVSDS